MKAISKLEEWERDHVTKRTNFKFPSGKINTIKTVEKPTSTIDSFERDRQHVKIRFPDGTVDSIVNKAISETVTWSEDKRTKLTNYKFADGSTHSDEVRVDAILVKTEYDKDIEINTFKLGDGTFETKKEKATSKIDEWAGDHVTKRTHFKFASGKTNTIKTVEKPTSTIDRYERNLQNVKIIYPDGTVDLVVNKAISESVTWSEDKRTKLTKYKFADSSTHSDEVRVEPILVKTEYDKDVEINTFKLGDGTFETKKEKATSKIEEWERDHVTKRTHFHFASGKTNTIKTVEKPIRHIISYERNLQYVNIRFPDGTVDSIVNKAISESVTWRDDHITRATHYKFKDGTDATTYDTVLPKRQSPTYLQDEQTILTQYADEGAINGLIENKSLVKADGGLVVMSAKAANSLAESVIQNTGTVQAQTVEKKAGRIFLLGDMTSGKLNVDGVLDASAPTQGDGGFVETSAAKVQILNSAVVTTKAAQGKTGKWLVDPQDYTVAASGGDQSGSQLSTALGTTNVELQSSALQRTSGSRPDAPTAMHVHFRRARSSTGPCNFSMAFFGGHL